MIILILIFLPLKSSHVEYTDTGVECKSKCDWSNDTNSSSYFRECLDIRGRQDFCTPFTCKGPFKYYVINEVGGWGQKMAIFDDLQYYKSSKRWVGGPKKVNNMMT